MAMAALASAAKKVKHDAATSPQPRITRSVAASLGLGALLLTLLLAYTTRDSLAHPLAMLPLSTQSMTSAEASAELPLLDPLSAMERAPTRPHVAPSIRHASHALHGAISGTSTRITQPSDHAEQAATALHGKAQALSLAMSKRVPEQATRKHNTITPVEPTTSHNDPSSSVIATSAQGEAEQPKRIKRIKKKIDWLYQR